ncbi:MAG: helix-turn-helix domain-containing protein [Patescibacteria group bacterium]
MGELKQKLIDFGFSEKEACVYLAMLELGPSSVQDIAKNAGVNRATTYVMIESLKRRGLLSSVEREKRICFVAESPEHLVAITREEESRIERKRLSLESLMPQFLALYNSTDAKPRVRFFEGEEGIAAAREVQAERVRSQTSCDVFIRYDAAMVRLAQIDQSGRLRLGNLVPALRVLYALDEGLTVPVFPRNIALRQVPSSLAPFDGECSIYDDFVVLSEPAPRPIAVVIDSREFATLFKRLFDLAWMAAIPPGK